jgi:hypothetical protein
MIYRIIFGDLKMRHTKWGADATSCGLSFPALNPIWELAGPEADFLTF